MHESVTVPPRYHFAPGVALEPVSGPTYRWVDPIDGTHRGYVVALHVDYETTIDAQIARGRRP